MNKEFWETEVFEIYRKNKPEKLPISEPPCKLCKFWYPHVEFKSNIGYNGIRCCIAEEMYHDFSCFESEDDN